MALTDNPSLFQQFDWAPPALMALADTKALAALLVCVPAPLMALAETNAWAAGASRSVPAVTNPVIVFLSFISFHLLFPFNLSMRP